MLEIEVRPLPEQERIVALLTDELAAAERARNAAQAELAAEHALPAALLRRSFRGEI